VTACPLNVNNNSKIIAECQTGLKLYDLFHLLKGLSIDYNTKRYNFSINQAFNLVCFVVWFPLSLSLFFSFTIYGVFRYSKRTLSAMIK
jgi:hypothetical protein